MLAKILSGTTIGLDGVLIEVEVDVAGKGFPTFTIVGLPDKSVDEAKDRVRTAIANISFEMPDSRLTVNLAPADIPKEGSSFDLPIAIGILAATGMIKKESLVNSLFIGELSLEGKIRGVNGIISIVLMAKKQKIKNIYLPYKNTFEASLVDNVNIFPIGDLGELVLHLNDEIKIEPLTNLNLTELNDEEIPEIDFADIKGQELAKRALLIAAAGFHNVHFTGPPGAGKTMLSRVFPTILPAMNRSEILDVTRIYSVSGLMNDSFYIKKRPFRSPHHTTSRIGLIGGGSNPRPGEISLAHRGVLFLDEFPEFPRSVLESLRQPLEDGFVTVSRASGSVTFPCRFILLAASNPCPCGYLGHPKKRCRCLPGMIIKYKKKLSGPLIDRIDLHVDVPAVDYEKLISQNKNQTSTEIKQKVIQARQKQEKRFINSRIISNGEMSSVSVKKYCKFSVQAVDLLKQAIIKLSLSARSYFKVIKISQTIADLESAAYRIEPHHVAEALQYRAKEE